MKYKCCQISTCLTRLTKRYLIVTIIVFSAVFIFRLFSCAFHSKQNRVSSTLVTDHHKRNVILNVPGLLVGLNTKDIEAELDRHEGNVKLNVTSLLAGLNTKDIEAELEKRASTKKRRYHNCDKVIKYHIGPIKPDFTVPKDFQEVEDFLASVNLLSGIKNGGLWKPTDCTPSIKTAILLPYRSRSKQLRVIIKHLHPILQKQTIHYRIFVIEQGGAQPFNKGKLLNSAVKEIQKIDNFDCIVFNDLDMFATNGQLRYDCPVSPFHMSGKHVQSASYFGGVIALWRKHYEDINGFSNLYWGWGAEDDDMYWRLYGKQYKIVSSTVDVGKFEMMNNNHFRSDGAIRMENTHRVGRVFKQSVALKKKQSSDQWIYAEGFNDVEYNLTHSEEHPLYTLMSFILYYNSTAALQAML